MLQLGPNLLQLELAAAAGGEGGLLGALLLGLRAAFELGDDAAELVLALADEVLGLLVGHLAVAAELRLGLLGVGLRAGLGDLGLRQDVREPLAADAVEVRHVVGDRLDLQRVEGEPELVEVVAGLADELVGELQPVLVDLFRRQPGDDAAQVTLEALLGDLLDLVRVASEKALDGVVAHALLARHLHVRDGVEGERDAAFGVGVRDRELDRDRAEVHPVDLLEQGHAPHDPAVHHAVPDLVAIGELVLASGEDQELVGTPDEQHALEEDEQTERERAEPKAHESQQDLHPTSEGQS